MTRRTNRLLAAGSALVAAFFSLAFLLGFAWPFWDAQPMLMGVNLPSGTFAPGKVPGTVDQDYFYPSGSDIDYYAQAGMNVVRIGFIWERLQPNLDQPLDAEEARRLDSAVQGALGRQMAVILDLHNYARYRGQVIGSPTVPIEKFADFWAKVALIYKGNNRVRFGLMNEPHDIDAVQWRTAVQAALDRIRDVGSRNPVLIAPTQWASAAHFTDDGDIWKQINDPARNFAFEVHQYLDPDGSGTQANCPAPAPMLASLQRLTGWMRETEHQVFLSEFGGSARTECLAAISQLLAHIKENSDVWLGWTYFAGGRGWSETDLLSIAPIGAQEKPQMKVLKTYLPKSGG